MNKIGIIFGTDTGYTRKIAKLIAKRLGDELADKPINVNRLSPEEFLAYKALILGTPTYGDGVLPGLETGIEGGSWAEFLPRLKGTDLSDKVIALYGFGDQEKYGDRYVSAMGTLYHELIALGATVIGAWPTDGYKFDASKAVVDGQFVGLALDDKNQGMLTEERVERWLGMIKGQLETAA